MSSRKYSVNNIKQLIDLNGDTTNFELEYKVSTLNGPFDIAITDQKTLDTQPSVEYRRVQKEITGKVVSDDDVHHSFFIILKADEPCEIVVETMKREIAPRQQPSSPPQQQQEKQPEIIPPKSFLTTNQKVFLFIGVATIACILIYVYYFDGKKVISEAFSPTPTPPVLTSSPLPMIELPHPASLAPTPAPAPAPAPAPVPTPQRFSAKHTSEDIRKQALEDLYGKIRTAYIAKKRENPPSASSSTSSTSTESTASTSSSRSK